MQRLVREIIQSKEFGSVAVHLLPPHDCHPYRYYEHESLSVQRCRRMIRRYSLVLRFLSTKCGPRTMPRQTNTLIETIIA